MGAIDVDLFRLINERAANPLCDTVMPWLARGPVIGGVFAAAAALVLFRAYRDRDPDVRSAAWLGLLAAVLAMGLGEGAGAVLLKPLIARPRPPFALDHVRVLGMVSHTFSFPSDHALVTTAGGAALLGVDRRVAVGLLGYAAVVSCSRVYTGAHYPSDVLAGAALGLLLGWIGSRVGRWLARATPTDDQPTSAVPRPRREPRRPVPRVSRTRG